MWLNLLKVIFEFENFIITTRLKSSACGCISTVLAIVVWLASLLCYLASLGRFHTQLKQKEEAANLITFCRIHPSLSSQTEDNW